MGRLDDLDKKIAEQFASVVDNEICVGRGDDWSFERVMGMLEDGLPKKWVDNLSQANCNSAWAEALDSGEVSQSYLEYLAAIYITIQDLKLDCDNM